MEGQGTRAAHRGYARLLLHNTAIIYYLKEFGFSRNELRAEGSAQQQDSHVSR